MHCKPVGDGHAALKYLAPYIHRVAIRNRRLIAFDDRSSMERSQVTFQYRTSDTRQLQTCSLSVEQFFQRFLQHVLPLAFVKVRYYGFFGASIRRKLAALQTQLGKPMPASTEPAAANSQEELDPPSRIICPSRGQPMTFQRNLTPQQCRSP